MNQFDPGVIKTSSCTTADDVLDIFKGAPHESFTVRKIASRIQNIPAAKVRLEDCGIIYAKISNLRKSRSIKLDGLVPNGGHTVLSYSLRI